MTEPLLSESAASYTLSPRYAIELVSRAGLPARTHIHIGGTTFHAALVFLNQFRLLNLAREIEAEKFHSGLAGILTWLAVSTGPASPWKIIFHLISAFRS